MWFLVLVGCYERVVMDVQVHVGRQEVEVLSQQQGVEREIEGTACTDAPSCVASIRSQLERERTELMAAGATDIHNGVFLRDGELDLVTHYRAPFSSSLFAGGSPLRVVEQSGRGKPRPVMVVLETPDDENSRSTVAVLGPHARYPLGDLGALTTLTRGHPRVHVEHQTVSDGVDLVVEPWVASVPGLAEAIQAAGLILDPAGLAP